jgi:hypothetical protein
MSDLEWLGWLVVFFVFLFAAIMLWLIFIGAGLDE